MKHLTALLICTPTVLALARDSRAQWSSTTHNPSQSVYAGDWFVAHENSSGLLAFSAIGQTWTTVSPTGSTFLAFGNTVVLTREAGNVLRGWSALRNASATQAVSANINPLTSPDGDFALVLDLAPATNGVLRAYSSRTNTWASLALPQIATFSPRTSRNVAVQQIGNQYHAYSAYTGQWTVLNVATPGGGPTMNDNCAIVDLRGTAGLGPRQYAAFSAIRGTWSLSPIYPSAGAGATASRNVAVTRVELPNPGQVAFAGFSANSGGWVTSTLVHSTASTLGVVAFGNLVRVQDSDVAARYEVFGAGNNQWQTLAGSGLSEQLLREDFDVVVNNTTGMVHAVSGLVGGGWTPLATGNAFPFVSGGNHAAMVGDNSTRAWGYSPAFNQFTGPVAFPIASGTSVGAGGAVVGFNVQGSSAFGTSAQAFTARWGAWVAGPAISPSESWSTLLGGTGSVQVTYRNNFGSYDFHVFDEHLNRWLAPVNSSPDAFSTGPNCFVHWRNATGSFQAYSAQRGEWSSISGVGGITSPGGHPNQLENLFWFTDSNLRLWVFPTPDRLQTWAQWPLASEYATSGTTAGGATPSLGFAMRGQPANEVALVYGSLSLAAAPLSLPGVGGVLDLNPASLFLVQNLGAFDADGVLEARLPIASPLPGGLPIWLQAITVNLTTFQVGFAGRATGSRFF